MELLSTLLVLNLILVSVIIVLFIKKNKVSLTNIYTGIDNMQDDEYFSKAVKQYYLDFIKEPNKYSNSGCTIQKSGSTASNDIVIWIANDIESRCFYTHSKEKQDEVKELNSKLTHFDKILLDKISKTIKDRNINLEEKIFF